VANGGNVNLSPQNLDEFFKQINSSKSTVNTAAGNSLDAAARLVGYITGSILPDQSYGFDAVVSTLFKNDPGNPAWSHGWQGDAAIAFSNQVSAVRKFGMDVAALLNYKVNDTPDYSGLPSYMQYEIANSTPVDFNQATGNIGAILETYSQFHTDATHDGSGKSHPEWARYLTGIITSAMQDRRGTTYVDSTGAPEYSFTYHVPTFEEWTNSPSGDFARPAGSGLLAWVYRTPGAYGDPNNATNFTLIYARPGSQVVEKSYQANKTYGAEMGIWPHYPDDSYLANEIFVFTKTTDYYPYLNTLVSEMGELYQTIKMPPTPDSSKLPHGQTSTSGPGGPNTQMPSVGGPSSFTGGTFVPPSSSTLPGATGLAGGTFQPGTPTSPLSGNVGSSGGTFDPSQLASFNGGLPGSGFNGTGGLGGPVSGGTFGTASVPGVSSAGVLGGSAGTDGAGGLAGGLTDGLAGGAAGLGAESGAAGAAATAGRSMMPPMYPMGGMGAGKDGQGRQRGAYLTEDEDVWGASTDGGSAVL
jgi:hypothetical protein